MVHVRYRRFIPWLDVPLKSFILTAWSRYGKCGTQTNNYTAMVKQIIFQPFLFFMGWVFFFVFFTIDLLEWAGDGWNNLCSVSFQEVWLECLHSFGTSRKTVLRRRRRKIDFNILKMIAALLQLDRNWHFSWCMTVCKRGGRWNPLLDSSSHSTLPKNSAYVLKKTSQTTRKTENCTCLAAYY